MDIVKRKISEVIPYENNPRINNKAIQVVARSIREFGFINPIVVDKDGIIVVGHTRFEASKVLGYEEVPVLVVDELSEEQVKAFRIMDNKSGEVSEWDYNKLIQEIEELKDENYDIDFTGFSDEDFEELVGEFELDESKKKEDKPEIEFTQELLEEHQHIVLTFDNTLDWQTAKDIFEIEPKKSLDSKEGYRRVGTGRVVNGSKFIDKIRGLK